MRGGKQENPAKSRAVGKYQCDLQSHSMRYKEVCLYKPVGGAISFTSTYIRRACHVDIQGGNQTPDHHIEIDYTLLEQ